MSKYDALAEAMKEPLTVTGGSAKTWTYSEPTCICPDDAGANPQCEYHYVQPEWHGWHGSEPCDCP